MIAILTLLACGVPETDPEEQTSVTTATGVVGTGDVDPRVRVMHHVFDLEVAAVNINGAATNLSDDFPLGASSAYLDFIPPATYAIELREPDTGDVAIAFDPVDAADGDAITMVAYGFYIDKNWATVGEAGAATTVVFDDDLDDIPEGMARLRFWNGVVGGLLFAPLGLDFLVDGVVVASGVGYGDSVVLELPLGDAIWGVDYTGDGVSDLDFAASVTEADFDDQPRYGHISWMPGDVLAGEDLVAYALLYPPHKQEPAVFLPPQ